MPEPTFDPMAKWTPMPVWAEVGLEREGWSARPVLGLGQALVGGKLAPAIDALAPGAVEAGLWTIVPDLPCVVRIARDKALIVTAAPLVFRTGWNAGGWTASPADAAHGVIEIAGTAVREIVSEATSADVDVGSRSAAIQFAGVPVLLYRTAPDVARVHVEIGLAAYLWRWLEVRP